MSRDNWGHAAVSQGMPKIAGKPKARKRQERILLHRFQRAWPC